MPLRWVSKVFVFNRTKVKTVQDKRQSVANSDTSVRTQRGFCMKTFPRKGAKTQRKSEKPGSALRLCAFARENSYQRRPEYFSCALRYTTLFFHPPRRKTTALTTASVEKAIVIATNIP